MAKRRTPSGLIRFDGAQVVRPTSVDDAEPKWNKLFPLGKFHRNDFPGGELNFTPAFLQSMFDNWVKGGRKAKPIDSLHRGDSGEDGLPAEEKSARGWIEDLKLESDGLYGLVRWNAKGLAFVLGDEYRYLSPSFHPDWVDTHTGKRQGPTLFGAGLLNNPFLEELPRVAASALGEQPEESTVNKKLLCARLGIVETSTDEEINAALEKSETLKLQASKDSEALKLAQTKLETVTAEATKLATHIKQLETEKAETALKALTDKLESEGRIIAADKEQVGALVAAIGIDGATKLVASWPVKVKLGEHGIGGSGTGDLSREEALKQLQAKADELVKAGTPRRDALTLAQEQNPKLTLVAHTTHSPGHEPKATA